MADYSFSNAWFEQGTKKIWDQLIPQIKPKKLLEIGSFEGASACYLIDSLSADSDIELHCVDTWEGGVEHKDGGTFMSDMSAVEVRFNANIKKSIENSKSKVDLVLHKGLSDVCLARLLGSGKRNYFDFIYVDGSHQAPDVLCDAILSFKMLKIGGYMAFDDYLWAENLPDGKDPIRCPKIAIDSFVNIFCRKIRVISAPIDQIYLQKISD
jgi:predicted O-methyltransferase YrrM